VEELSTLFALISGVLIRLAIPLLVTAFAVWLLKRLDARWQREAEEGIQMDSGQVPLFDRLQCWMTNDCPRENLAKCPAYRERGRPCWQVFREDSGQLREGCLDCDVFRKAPVPVSV
jgi:hypothetical protein